MKSSNAAFVGGIHVGAQERRRQSPEEQPRRGHGAVVHLIAHAQRLSDERLQFDGTTRLQGARHGRAEDVAHPAQAVQDLLVVGAKA